MTRYFTFSFLLFIFVLLSGLWSSNWEDYEKAVHFFRQAEFDSVLTYALKVEDSDSLYFYSRLLAGHAFLELDQLDKARETFESPLPFQQNRYFIYNGLGLYYLYSYQKSRAVTRFLKKFFSSDDLDKSLQLFERAVRMNPDYLDAKLNKNRALVVSGKRDEIAVARQNLEILASANPGNTEILFYLGKSQEESGDQFAAITTYENILRFNPDHSAANLALAFIYFRKGEYELFSQHYLKALPALYDQQIIRDLYQDIVDILAQDELNYARKHRLNGEFFRDFWQSRDPVKITSENERLIEHYKRLDYARANYPGNNQAGYDDRGIIYIKYGPPYDYYRFSTADGYVLENESWVYIIDGETYNFDFINEQTGYILRTDLSTAVVNPDVRVALNNLGDLYSRRAHLSNYYASIYQELVRLQPRGTTDYLPAVSSIFSRFNSRENVKINKLPVSVYNLKMEGTDLPFEFDHFRFFDHARSKWFVDIFYGLPLNELTFRLQDNQFTADIHQKLLIFSADHQRESRTFEKTINIVSKERTPDSYFTNKLSSPLYPGQNQVHFQLKEEGSDKFRIIQTDLNAVYPEKHLLVSEILLSDSIRLQQEKDNPVFCRNGYYIRPKPGRNFVRETPVYCYFELYNIVLDEKGTGRCLIESKIKDHQTGRNLSSLLDYINPFKGGEASKSAVSISNEFQFSRTSEPIIMAFDVSHIDNGVYEFIITATDRNSGQSVSENKLLHIAY